MIDGFRIEDTSWAGISLRDANNMVVQNNHTYETGASGIIVMPDKYFDGGEAEVTSKNIKVLNNTVERANWKWRSGQQRVGAPQEALTLWGVDGFEIGGNLLKESTKEGIDVKVGTRNGSIHSNTVTGTAQVSGDFGSYRGGPAIYVDGNRANTFNIDIYNNVVHNNTADGIIIADEDIAVGGVSDIRVYNNVVYDNGKMGVNGGVGIGVVHNAKDVEIVNNTVAGNIKSFVLGGSSGQVQVEDILVRNNIFADSQFRSGVLNNAKNVTFDNNLSTEDFDVLFRSGSVSDLRESQNETVDSIDFLNPGKDNFRLKSSSAAINNGSSKIGAYALEDFNGVTRPLGGGIDQGAFEFGQGSAGASSQGLLGNEATAGLEIAADTGGF